MDENQGWWSRVFDDVSMSYGVDDVSIPNISLVDEDYEQIVRPKQEIVDFSDVFTANEIFGSRDKLLNWVRGTAMEHSFVVVIVRSDSGGNGRKTKLVLGCERSGKYMPYKSKLVRNVTSSRKCGCPFRLRGRPLANGGGWKLNVVCGVHNHDVAENLEWHPYAGRLSVKEKSLLKDMTKSMVKPMSILLTLKDHNEHNVTKIKQGHAPRETTNMVESADARLKRLQDSRGDIMYFGFIQVEKVHAHWRRLTFTDQVTDVERAGLTLCPKLDELERRFDELDMNGKVAFKYKVRELAFPNTTSMYPPHEKVRIKGSTKGESQKESSTKRDPSFFVYVDAMQSSHDSNSTRPS
ncbi:hypothetical protein SESBI_39627 [Sesbania bispinosa]|nr:hypothetical protein SESBI_39627 [Sesbania bispinosa]